MGVPPGGAAVASFVVLLLFHDHWNHIPDADDLADEDPSDDSPD